VNHNKFYSATGKGFEGSINGTNESSLASWRSYTGFDTSSGETIGTSISQQEADFTPAGHTPNEWSYLYSEDGESSFLDMQWNQSRQLWEGPGSDCVIGAGWEQPGGSSCDAVLTWTATEAETAIIAGDSPISVQAGCGGSGVNIRILQNGSQIWPSSGWKSLAKGAKYVFPGVTAVVSADDQLHFVIQHMGSNNDCDATYWIPTVVSHP
jgi:hypothetical protein